MTKPFTRIAAVLFAIGAVLHLLRLLTSFSFVIGGVQIPLWVNILGLIITATFAVMLWKEAESSRPPSNQPDFR